MSKKVFYMHTIDHQPGVWADHQICFANRDLLTSEMCKSLHQIRRQQNLSARYREERLNESRTLTRYGYKRVVVDC